jgi:hypothetical protein
MVWVIMLIVCDGFTAHGGFECRVLREIFGAEGDGNRGTGAAY